MTHRILVLSLLLLCLTTQVQAAGRVFTDGFEDGNTNKWMDDGRGKIPIVTSSVDGIAGPHSGTHMAGANFTGNNSFPGLVLNTDVLYNNELFLRMWERPDGDIHQGDEGSGCSFKLLRFFFAEGTTYHDYYTVAGHPMESFTSAGNAWTNSQFPTYWGGAAGDHTNNKSSWHKVEMYVNQSAGIFRVWHDGVMVQNNTGYDFHGVKWTPFYIQSNGDNCGIPNNHWYLDDFEVYSDTGSGATGLMSDASIQQPSGPDTTPPTVSSVTPTNGATGIALTTDVTATMSEDLNAATVTTSTVELRNPSNTLITATVSESAPGVITLHPTTSLVPSTVYTAKVIGGGSGVKDVAGNALASTFTWTFTTVAPDTTPPTVSGVSPANSATNISTTIAPTITFSEPMDPATISTSTIDLKSSPGAVLVASTVSYNATTRVATLTPNVPLAISTSYTLRAIGGGSGVKDVAGNALASTQSASFTTTSSTSDTTLGLTTIGTKMDDGDSNYMNGSKIVTVTGGTVASMSVYVGAIDATTANRSYQFGIYTNNASTNKPDTLVASTTSGTLTANSWNTLPITATLNPATTYWLLYNTNGLSSAVNNMAYNTTSAGQGVYSTGNMTFGTWPGTFPASTLTTTTYSLYVTFAPPPPTTFALTVVKAGTGGGTVTSSPGGISCGSDCTESYSGNTVVTLTPTPDGSSTFIGWSGDADCTDGTVTMDAIKNCNATFNSLPPSTFNLTISKAGTGTGTVTGTGIACGTDCTETYPTGTVVELSSTADATSTFTGYTGTGCTTGSITMDSSKACVATFVLKPPPIVNNGPVCIRVQ
jgi:hypothetical protein